MFVYDIMGVIEWEFVCMCDSACDFELQED